ncbi:MAG TPA: hypothetical protein VMF03_00005 [Steroidobacteraceae bacterium]|nr:hypothetical protein [Steroidobacteraceae bacterium]
MSAVGYSITPLAKKLGIKPGSRVCAVGAPAGYADLVAPLPAGVRMQGKPSAMTDITHLFTTDRRELSERLRSLRLTLNPNATVWVSWPKKASKVVTTVTEETVREIALPLGFVDVKVCAVNEVWSGLKLVVRKALR